MTVTTIILESDDPTPVLIEGLTVRLFDIGGSFVTSAVTDSSGEAIVDVPDDDYDLFFFKTGVSINDGMPQRITVDSADTDTPPNTFKVIAHIATLPEATDPALCLISGKLRASDGSYSQDGRLVFAPVVEAGFVAGDLLSPKNYHETVPNEDGDYSFTLLRGQEYRAYFVHIQRVLDDKEAPAEFRVIVPDLPALHVKDLLFPVPVSATFSSTTLALTAGDEADESIELTVTYSDNSDRTKNPALGTSFKLKSDNDDVIKLERVGKKLIITPLEAGVANITIERTLSEFFVFDPAPAFTTETLEVTVT